MTEGEESSLAVETSQTDTRTRSVEQTTSQTVGVEQEFSLFPPSFGGTSVSYEASFSESTTDETSVSWSNSSTETLSRFAERATSESRTSGQQLIGGKLRVGVLLRNIVKPWSLCGAALDLAENAPAVSEYHIIRLTDY